MDILRFKPNNHNENVEAHTVANLISLLPDGRYANIYKSFLFIFILLLSFVFLWFISVFAWLEEN